MCRCRCPDCPPQIFSFSSRRKEWHTQIKTYCKIYWHSLLHLLLLLAQIHFQSSERKKDRPTEQAQRESKVVVPCNSAKIVVQNRTKVRERERERELGHRGSVVAAEPNDDLLKCVCVCVFFVFPFFPPPPPPLLLSFLFVLSLLSLVGTIFAVAADYSALLVSEFTVTTTTTTTYFSTLFFNA